MNRNRYRIQFDSHDATSRSEALESPRRWMSGSVAESGEESNEGGSFAEAAVTYFTKIAQVERDCCEAIRLIFRPASSEIELKF
jgi:hypothetical protein